VQVPTCIAQATGLSPQCDRSSSLTRSVRKILHSSYTCASSSSAEALNRLRGRCRSVVDGNVFPGVLGGGRACAASKAISKEGLVGLVSGEARSREGASCQEPTPARISRLGTSDRSHGASHLQNTFLVGKRRWFVVRARRSCPRSSQSSAVGESSRYPQPQNQRLLHHYELISSQRPC
jgi:hypothetical protein